MNNKWSIFNIVAICWSGQAADTAADTCFQCWRAAAGALCSFQPGASAYIPLATPTPMYLTVVTQDT